MADLPLTNFHFQVQWGGTRIGFAEVQHLSLSVDVIEYRDGSSPVFSAAKLPGRTKFENIVLKRGVVTGDNEFFTWWNTVARNSAERRDIVISLLNESHEPVINWKVRNAFPVKLTWSDLKASASEVVIETLEIANEGITVEHS